MRNIAFNGIIFIFISEPVRRKKHYMVLSYCSSRPVVLMYGYQGRTRPPEDFSAATKVNSIYF